MFPGNNNEIKKHIHHKHLSTITLILNFLLRLTKKSLTCCSLLKASSAPSRFLSSLCSTKLKFPPRIFFFFRSKPFLSLSNSSSSILLLLPFLPKLNPWKLTTLKLALVCLHARFILMILPGSSDSNFSMFPLTVC